MQPPLAEASKNAKKSSNNRLIKSEPSEEELITATASTSSSLSPTALRRPLIDISTPENLERDFHAWLKGELRAGKHHTILATSSSSSSSSSSPPAMYHHTHTPPGGHQQMKQEWASASGIPVASTASLHLNHPEPSNMKIGASRPAGSIAMLPREPSSHIHHYYHQQHTPATTTNTILFRPPQAPSLQNNSELLMHALMPMPTTATFYPANKEEPMVVQPLILSSSLSAGGSSAGQSPSGSCSTIDSGGSPLFSHQLLAGQQPLTLLEIGTMPNSTCELPQGMTNQPPSSPDESSRSSGTNQLGRTYSPGLPLSMSERQQIVQLHQEGWKICDISKKMLVTHSCVSKILQRFRATGSVRPKDAKEGRQESPLVAAIRDYRMRLGIVRQSEIREQLIRDGICRRDTAPSRSSINHIWLPTECWVDTLKLLSRRQLLRGVQPACRRMHAIGELPDLHSLHIIRNFDQFLDGLQQNMPEANRQYAELTASETSLARHFRLGANVTLNMQRRRALCLLRHSLELFRGCQLHLMLKNEKHPTQLMAASAGLTGEQCSREDPAAGLYLAYLSQLVTARPSLIHVTHHASAQCPELQPDVLLSKPIVLACPRLNFYSQLNAVSAETICQWLHHYDDSNSAGNTRLFNFMNLILLRSTCSEIIERCKQLLRQAKSASDQRLFLLNFRLVGPLLSPFKLENSASGEVLQLEERSRGRQGQMPGPNAPLGGAVLGPNAAAAGLNALLGGAAPHLNALLGGAAPHLNALLGGALAQLQNATLHFQNAAQLQLQNAAQLQLQNAALYFQNAAQLQLQNAAQLQLQNALLGGAELGPNAAAAGLNALLGGAVAQLQNAAQLQLQNAPQLQLQNAPQLQLANAPLGGAAPETRYHLRRCPVAELANADKFYRDTFRDNRSQIVRAPVMDNGLEAPILKLFY